MQRETERNKVQLSTIGRFARRSRPQGKAMPPKITGTLSVRNTFLHRHPIGFLTVRRVELVLIAEPTPDPIRSERKSVTA